MTCETIEMDLLAYLTDELDDAEAAQVREHLTTCSSCAAEAEELRAVSQHLSARMKEIPEALDIPPLVAARIDRALKEEQRQTRRRSWLPGIGVVAAAAAAVLVTFSVRPDVAERVADVPVVGVVAGRFLQPDYDLRLGTAPASTAGAVGALQRKDPNVTATANGVSVTVTRVEYQANQTQITYRAKSATLLKDVGGFADFVPVVTVDGRPAKLYRLTVDQRGPDVLFQLSFEAVNPVTEIALRLNALPLVGTAQADPWAFTVK